MTASSKDTITVESVNAATDNNLGGKMSSGFGISGSSGVSGLSGSSGISGTELSEKIKTSSKAKAIFLLAVYIQRIPAKADFVIVLSIAVPSSI